MTCTELRRRLLEAGPEDRLALEPHLLVCPECRRLAAALDAEEAHLHDALDTFEVRDADEVWRRARAAADPTPTTPPRWFMIDAPLHTALALAAAVALTVTGVWSALPPSAPEGLANETPSGDTVEWSAVDQTLDDARAIPWDALSEQDWGLKAMELRDLWLTSESAPAPEREAHLASRLRLAAEWGRAAENCNVPAPPHFDVEPGAGMVNVGFWEAARLALLLDRPEVVRELGSSATTVRFYMAKRRGDPEPFPVHQVEQAVARVGTTPWNGLSEKDWRTAAWTLHDHCTDLWPSRSKSADYGSLALTCVAQLGRAAENANDPSAPFFREIEGKMVNYYWLVAGGILAADRSLASELDDPQVRKAVEHYADWNDTGKLVLEVPPHLD